MNFNQYQRVVGGQSPGGSIQQPQGMQQVPQRTQMQNPQPPLNSLSLPPQLANLSPQQLQQLKNQPQFQALLKSHTQRQQMLQQQLIARQMQAQTGNQKMVNNQVPQMTTQRIQDPNVINQMQSKGLFPRSDVSGQVFPSQAQMGRIQADVAQSQQGKIPFQMTSGQIKPEVDIPYNASMESPGQIAQQKLNANRDSQIGPYGSEQNELFRKVPLRELSSFHEWSDELKKEGKEIPTDVRVYESIIEKDSAYRGQLSKQIQGSERLMGNLVKKLRSYNDLKQYRIGAINLTNRGQYSNSIWGDGYQGYGNGISNTPTRLISVNQNKRNSVVPELALTDYEINERVMKRLNTGKMRQLVPIRLDFDQERDKFKLRDTFLWDLYEDVFPLEYFVASLVEDYKFIPMQYTENILASIKEQIRDYHKRPEKAIGELRVPIKLEIIVNNTQFIDQFEWDILNYGENDAEEFASITCEELNLPGEFCTAIAHSVRDQTQLFHKALYLVGYNFDGSPVQEEEIRSHTLPALRQTLLVNEGSSDDSDFYSVLRNPAAVSDFSPSLTKLTHLELERIDKEIERESRRKRRHVFNEMSDSNQAASGFGPSSGRGTSRRSALYAGRGNSVPVLPDLSDIPKTFRTPVPSSVLPGGVDLGVPDIYGYNEVVALRSQVPNPNYKSPALLLSHDSSALESFSKDSERVSYSHNSLMGTFNVTIKLSK